MPLESGPKCPFGSSRAGTIGSSLNRRWPSEPGLRRGRRERYEGNAESFLRPFRRIHLSRALARVSSMFARRAFTIKRTRRPRGRGTANAHPPEEPTTNKDETMKLSGARSVHFGMAPLFFAAFALFATGCAAEGADREGTDEQIAPPPTSPKKAFRRAPPPWSSLPPASRRR